MAVSSKVATPDALSIAPCILLTEICCDSVLVAASSNLLLIVTWSKWAEITIALELSSPLITPIILSTSFLLSPAGLKKDLISLFKSTTSR